MKKILIKYGTIASAIVVGFPVLTSLFIGFGRESFSTGELVGYTSMIVAMCSVYFAMRHFRDNVNEGVMSFAEGMKIGLSISAIGGLAWAIYNYIFVTWIMPDFNEQYFAYVSGHEIGTPEFNAGFADMMQTSGFMYSKLGGSLVMFLTVFLIGLVISSISSLIVRRNQAVAKA